MEDQLLMIESWAKQRQIQFPEVINLGHGVLSASEIDYHLLCLLLSHQWKLVFRGLEEYPDQMKKSMDECGNLPDLDSLAKGLELNDRESAALLGVGKMTFFHYRRGSRPVSTLWPAEILLRFYGVNRTAAVQLLIPDDAPPTRAQAELMARTRQNPV